MTNPSKNDDELPSPVRRNPVWRTIQLILQGFFPIWLRYRSYGRERLPPEGGALFLVNHQSYLDPLLIGATLTRPVSFLARDTLFKVPVVGWILRNTYVMPINREAASTASIRETVRRMQHGFYVGIFPEGTRTLDGGVGEFKPGFIALVRRGKVPVVPVGIAGAYEAYPKGAWFIRPAKVRVVFGEPLTEREIEEYCVKGKETEFAGLVRERIVALVGEAERLR